MKLPVRLAFGLSATLLVACGAVPEGGAQAPTFGAAPFQTVTSTSGRLRVEVRWSPATPVKGANAAQLTFLDAQGDVVDGISAIVVPWMPAHGHGTSIQPTMTEEAPGTDVAAPIYLYMSGEWQLRMTLSGAVEDTAVAAVQIP